MIKLCIIGHRGGNKIFNDGQTVKTKTLCNSLSRQNIQYTFLDTYYAKKRPFYFFFFLFVKSIFCNDFIILLSDNGRRILFPYLAILNRFKEKRVFHYGIGSKFSVDAENNKRIAKYLNSFTANWVEGVYMKMQL